MNERTKNFQGLRFLLILGIVCMHAKYPIIGEGWLICTFFFVLSGFLYKQPQNTGTYIKNKLIKVYPLYWLCLLLYFILNQWEMDKDVLPHVFLLQSYIPSSNAETFYYKYIGVSWFISSLMFCYILSPWLHKLLAKVKKENNMFLLVMLVTFMLMLRSSSDSIIPSGYGIWFFYISPFYRILEYALGLILQNIIKEKQQQKLPFQGLISVVVIVGYIFYMRNDMTVLYIPVIHLLMIYYIYMYKSKLMDIVWGNKIVVWLAKYGMAVYLSHQLLFRYLYEKMELSTLCSVLLSVGIGIILGWTYDFVKKKLSFK